MSKARRTRRRPGLPEPRRQREQGMLMINKLNRRKELRAELLERRRQLALQHPELGARLAEHVRAWLETQEDVFLVGFYTPIHCEPDLLPALSACVSRKSARGRALPVVGRGKSMTYCLWRPGEELVEDVFHTKVPRVKRQAFPDLVIAPCVGFTSQGFRLGYGAGCFDRMLENPASRPKTLAVAYEACRADGLFEPAAHDIPFDWVATELGVRPVSGRSGPDQYR